MEMATTADGGHGVLASEAPPRAVGALKVKHKAGTALL